jgi:hypothetical protein
MLETLIDTLHQTHGLRDQLKPCCWARGCPFAWLTTLDKGRVKQSVCNLNGCVPAKGVGKACQTTSDPWSATVEHNFRGLDYRVT